jgi:hypothetical protein
MLKDSKEDETDSGGWGMVEEKGEEILYSLLEAKGSFSKIAGSSLEVKVEAIGLSKTSIGVDSSL